MKKIRTEPGMKVVSSEKGEKRLTIYIYIYTHTHTHTHTYTHIYTRTHTRTHAHTHTHTHTHTHWHFGITIVTVSCPYREDYSTATTNYSTIMGPLRVRLRDKLKLKVFWVGIEFKSMAS